MLLPSILRCFKTLSSRWYDSKFSFLNFYGKRNDVRNALDRSIILTAWNRHLHILKPLVCHHFESFGWRIHCLVHHSFVSRVDEYFYAKTSEDFPWVLDCSKYFFMDPSCFLIHLNLIDYQLGCSPLFFMHFSLPFYTMIRLNWIGLIRNLSVAKASISKKT